MYTISQVAAAAGITPRTLQYYDEIGLFKPSAATEAGYRLYDDEALEQLQQVLLLKELGFKLREIKAIVGQADRDRLRAFRRQKELLLLKRERLDRLIRLLDHLEKGEPCMSLKEFDLSEYIAALEDFKASNADDVARCWGSEENFDLLIRKIKADSGQVAAMAIQHYGSVAKYTEAMKDNLAHFSDRIAAAFTDEAKAIGAQSDALYRRLTADLSRDVASPEVRAIVRELLQWQKAHSADDTDDAARLDALIRIYSSDYVQTVADRRFGPGAAAYIIEAFRACRAEGKG